MLLLQDKIKLCGCLSIFLLICLPLLFLILSHQTSYCGSRNMNTCTHSKDNYIVYISFIGVRYNAEKKKVGNYYTTPIYRFRMKCHLCDNHFEIETDPKVSTK